MIYGVPDYVAKNTRVASVWAAMEETREALSKTEVGVLLV